MTISKQRLVRSQTSPGRFRRSIGVWRRERQNTLGQVFTSSYRRMCLPKCDQPSTISQRAPISTSVLTPLSLAPVVRNSQAPKSSPILEHPPCSIPASALERLRIRVQAGESVLRSVMPAPQPPGAAASQQSLSPPDGARRRTPHCALTHISEPTCYEMGPIHHLSASALPLLTYSAAVKPTFDLRFAKTGLLP